MGAPLHTKHVKIALKEFFLNSKKVLLSDYTYLPTDITSYSPYMVEYQLLQLCGIFNYTKVIDTVNKTFPYRSRATHIVR